MLGQVNLSNCGTVLASPFGCSAKVTLSKQVYLILKSEGRNYIVFIGP